MEIIKTENLSFKYPNESKSAVSDITLSIEAGEFVTLCGKSGCGKSTLLRMLKPILTPHGETKGEVLFDGRAISSLSQGEQAEKIGFVFQNPDNQVVTDKVWHELSFGLESLSYSETEIRGRVAEMASFFGIQHWFYEDVKNLSGGQKQLLNLASVMIMQPSILILDEPTSQLDPIAAQDFIDTLLKINREIGTTIILTEHRLEETFAISDRVIVMDDGKIIANGAPNDVGELLKNENHDMFFALPTPMKVFFSLGGSGVCPINIRDGRQWLKNMEIKNKVLACDKGKKEESVAEFDNVWFKYEKNSPDIAKGLSLSLNSGEFYALVGENGSGKTTVLSLLSGILAPYRGKIYKEAEMKIALLSQNPQAMFVKKTVLLELSDVLEAKSGDNNKEELRKIVDFCELWDLLSRHPYDLSGGEQQRVALAKVLLTKPDILLLDEPTKGLDAHFKAKLAKMLFKLKQRGVSILAVSHDIEFCAKYADRCGMFFDGHIISEDVPKKFFLQKSFYTTSAGRMARGIVEGTVLDEDIIYALGGKMKEQKFSEDEDNLDNSDKNDFLSKKLEEAKKKKKKKLTAKNIVLGGVFGVLFLFIQFVLIKKYDGLQGYIFQMLAMLALGTSLFNFLPKRTFEFGKRVELKAGKISKKTALAILMVLIIIPITVLLGVKFGGERRYYITSLIVILEALLPFAMVFEGRRPQARELVIISVLCALTVSGRAAFVSIPQFKPVAAMIIVSGICFGGEAGFVVGAVSGFVSNFFFGQTPFTPWQMLAFGIIGFVSGIVFKNGFYGKTKTGLCIFGFFATLILYGGIINAASVILAHGEPNENMFLATYVASLPFDIVHSSSTAFFLFFIAEPMIEKIDRIRIKYGLIN